MLAYEILTIGHFTQDVPVTNVRVCFDEMHMGNHRQFGRVQAVLLHPKFGRVQAVLLHPKSCFFCVF